MTLVATCHCGANRIALPAHPAAARRCNCTYCVRTGAVWAYYAPEELTFLARDAEGTYTASGMNMHHFCTRCGISTWGDSPDWASLYNADGTAKNGDAGAMPSTRIYQVNLHLVEDLDWSRIAIEELDGRHSW